MARYTTKERMAIRELRRIVNNPEKPEAMREIAREVIRDDNKLAEYIFLKEKRVETIRRKKILEDKKKNLTGWKKWFIRFMPEGLILRLDRK